MFRSCNYISTSKQYLSNTVHRFIYRVVDDDFEDNIEVEIDIGTHPGIDIMQSVMAVYGNRKLPIVPNIMAAILWEVEKYGGSVRGIIGESLKHIPEFVQYKEELNKYLLLL